MSVLMSIFILGAIGAAAFYYWTQLFGVENHEERRRFYSWTARGLGFPLVIWLACNFDLLSWLSPLYPPVSDASPSGWDRFFGLVVILTPTLPVIASCWLAVTLAWLAGGIISQAEEKREARSIMIVCAVIGLPFMYLICHLFGREAIGFAFIAWLLPGVHFGIPLAEKRVEKPSYASAVAKLKRGHYAEAEQAVLNELEKKEDDIEGWLMLAEMYATQHHDLGAADKTIRELCDQPNVDAARVTFAFHRLADWHLKLGENPAAARRALDAIVQKYPESHFARMARQRINNLPADPEELRERQTAKTIRLPALNESFAEEQPNSGRNLTRRQAALEANRCVEKLKRKPNHIVARENFAVLLADHLDKCDLAIEQVQMLLDLPDQPETRRVEWLSWIASWHWKHKQDRAASQAVLERIARDFPHLPQSTAARRQIERMEMESQTQIQPPAAPIRIKVELPEGWTQ